LLFLPKEGVHVPELFRNLPWDLIGSNGMLEGLFAESKVVAKVDEWQRDAEPEAEQGQHGGERDSSARVFSPDEEV